jgi:hypothetical protein
MNLVFLPRQYHCIVLTPDDNHETIASVSVLTKNVEFAIKPIHSQTVDLYL